MAILGKIYDEQTKTDRVWYQSSNVFYSKFVENDNDNYGQLYVTFKNGATYHYKDVDMPTDYILFKNGGIDASQGKTLNKLIKGKYEFERVGDENITVLQEELDKLLEKKEDKKTFGEIVSGILTETANVVKDSEDDTDVFFMVNEMIDKLNEVVTNNGFQPLLG